MQDHLSDIDFFTARAARQGLIPISIDYLQNRVTWLDIGKYHFYEGFFYKSLNTFYALSNQQTDSFTTDLAILEDSGIAEGHIYPRGFIFHAGRCGSTILTKALARSQKNLVISEADPLNQIWLVFTRNGSQALEFTDRHIAIYKNLLLAMVRRRTAEHQNSFVKFSSHNVRFLPFIHAAFPDVPKIFLARNIDDIISSFEKRTSEWLKIKDPKIMELFTGYDQPDLRGIINGFLSAAVNQPEGVLKHIDYTELLPANLAGILSHFNYSPSEKELSLMQSQFQYDSKTELNKKRFER